MVNGIGVMKRGEPLACRAHHLVHHAGHVEHGGEGAVAADPSGQRFGRGHRRGAWRLAQQRDLADDQRRRNLENGRHSVAVGMGDRAFPESMSRNDSACSPWRISTWPAAALSGRSCAASDTRASGRQPLKISRAASSSALTAVSPAT